jgi:multiple sugar transport system ATP-binding protein
VTHDQTEAMTLGDRVAVLHDGRLQQVGPPESVYDSPANVFVASFLGSPPMNLLRGRLLAGAPAIELGPGRLVLDSSEVARHPDLERRAGSEVVVGVRPESFQLAGASERERIIEGVAIVRESLGSDVYVRFRAPGVNRLEGALSRLALADEDAEQVEVPGRNDAVLVARLPAGSTVARDEPIALAVGQGSVRLFDGESGVSLAEPASQLTKEVSHAG